MNLWECCAPGCESTATGAGGAAGLIAIGWYFVPGGTGGNLFCPFHRPDGKDCDESPTNVTPCSQCRAEWVADDWQQQINAAHGYEHVGRRRFLELLAVGRRHHAAAEKS